MLKQFTYTGKFVIKQIKVKFKFALLVLFQAIWQLQQGMWNMRDGSCHYIGWVVCGQHSITQSMANSCAYIFIINQLLFIFFLNKFQ